MMRVGVGLGLGRHDFEADWTGEGGIQVQEYMLD